jgi:hypothetical protein
LLPTAKWSACGRAAMRRSRAVQGCGGGLLLALALATPDAGEPDEAAGEPDDVADVFANSGRCGADVVGVGVGLVLGAGRLAVTGAEDEVDDAGAAAGAASDRDARARTTVISSTRTSTTKASSTSRRRQ